MRISDWSSDVCSSDLVRELWHSSSGSSSCRRQSSLNRPLTLTCSLFCPSHGSFMFMGYGAAQVGDLGFEHGNLSGVPDTIRSEEHTSELQSLMRISYAVFCLNKNKKNKQSTPNANP